MTRADRACQTPFGQACTVLLCHVPCRFDCAIIESGYVKAAANILLLAARGAWCRFRSPIVVQVGSRDSGFQGLQLVTKGSGPDFYGLPLGLRLCSWHALAHVEWELAFLGGCDGNSLAIVTDGCPTAKTSEIFPVMMAHVPSTTPCSTSRTLVRFRFWSSNCAGESSKTGEPCVLGTHAPPLPDHNKRIGVRRQKSNSRR